MALELLSIEAFEIMCNNLDPLDRFFFGLVCRSWAQRLPPPRTPEAVLPLPIPGFENAKTFWLNSASDHIKLRIAHASMMSVFNKDFWKRTGENLHDLELDRCRLSPEVFFYILEQCKRLESLALTGKTDLEWPTDGEFRVPHGVKIATVRDAMHRIKRLSLRKNPNVTNEKLGHILTMMPNVKYLCLDSCSKLKFEKFEYAAQAPSPSIVASLLKSSQKFVDLDFAFTKIDNDTLGHVIAEYGDSLLKLRLTGCEELVPDVQDTIARCSELQYLYLHPDLNEIQLRTVLVNLPDLRHLDIKGCNVLQDRDVLNLIQPRNMRNVKSFSCRNVSNLSLCMLADLRNIQALDFNEIQCDPLLFGELGRLTGLRVLKLVKCRDFDNECFGRICLNLTSLEELHIGNCENLTHDAIIQYRRLRRVRKLYLGHFPALEVLNCGRCYTSHVMKSFTLWSTGASGQVINHLVTHFPSLEYLHLHDCSELRDGDVVEMIRDLPELEVLRIQESDLLTERFMAEIKEQCLFLRHVDIGLTHVTERARRLFANVRRSVLVTVTDMPLVQNLPELPAGTADSDDSDAETERQLFGDLEL